MGPSVDQVVPVAHMLYNMYIRAYVDTCVSSSPHTYHRTHQLTDRAALGLPSDNQMGVVVWWWWGGGRMPVAATPLLASPPPTAPKAEVAALAAEVGEVVC